MSAVERAVTIEDLRRLAVKRLPDFIISYVERGAGDGGGVLRNINAFRKFQLVPRGLLHVTPVDTSTELFGRRYASPFGISAVGMCGVYRRHADEMIAETAREANIPFILSGSGSASIETICRLAPEHTWYQMYGAKDLKLTDHMMGRARDSGVNVLVFTVDYPVPPRSEVSARTGISLATGPTVQTFPKLLWDVLKHPDWVLEYLLKGGMPKLDSWAQYVPPASSAKQIARFYVGNWLNNQTWRDLDHIRSRWKGSLVVKGLIHPDDVVRAARAGADAVTVSNHGGNKLDCMQSCLDSLVKVKAVVGTEVPIFFDGGIRRGSDVLVAKAVGAQHCFVGRAALYGVAAGGANGVKRAVEILKSDLEYTMAMIGTQKVSDISGECLTVS